ncbi:hypothetical protein P7C70_g4564, partial [Phenoliferia sp. Uapishka_3]
MFRQSGYEMLPQIELPKKPVGRTEHIEDLSSYEFGAGGQEILKNERLLKDETNEKMGAFTYLLAGAAALSGFLFGYDTGVISGSCIHIPSLALLLMFSSLGALVNIGTDIGGKLLTDIEKEWVSAATSCGALIGGLLGGNIVDKYGRKWILALGDVFFVVGGARTSILPLRSYSLTPSEAILVATSFGLVQIIIGRIVLGKLHSERRSYYPDHSLDKGFGVGIAAAVTPMYIGEIAPTRFRGALVTIQSIMITLGQIVSYAFAAGMTFHGGWRALFAISLVPATFQAALIHFLPESPRYDLMNGRKDAAVKTLRLVYKGASDEMIEWKLQGMTETVRLSKVFQERWPLAQRLSIIAKTGAYRRPTIIACGLMAFQQLCGFNSLLYYSATIFEAAGFVFHPVQRLLSFTNGAAVGLIVAGTNVCPASQYFLRDKVLIGIEQFIFTMVAFFLMDRVGKRRLQLLTYPGIVFGLVMASVAFHFMTVDTGGKLITGYTDYPQSWTILMIISQSQALQGRIASIFAHNPHSLVIVVFVAFYATSLGNLPWHSAELFPLEIRGMGSSLLTASCWACNILISATFLSLLNGAGAAAAFGVYAGIGFLGLVFVYFCYPEVAGLSLEEVQTLFVEDFGIKAARSLKKQHMQVRMKAAEDADKADKADKVSMVEGTST